MKDPRGVDIPPDLPRAGSMDVLLCNNPDCGPHVVMYDRTGALVIAADLTVAHAVELVKNLQDVIQRKRLRNVN